MVGFPLPPEKELFPKHLKIHRIQMGDPETGILRSQIPSTSIHLFAVSTSP